jgi:hypothetical protein
MRNHTHRASQTTMIDYISTADKPLPRPEPRYLTPHPSTFRNYQCCPWAKTLIVQDVETGRPQLRPITCKRWGCGYCAPRKIRKLAFLTNGATPNRWIRLGVNPEQYTSPKEAWEKTTTQVPELCRQLRKTRGECEYLRVCELHQSGMPHYHAMLRSNFIPQRELSQIWGDLTGAPVVYIAKIDQTFSSFRYLTKYLTKLHRIEWTDRHVSYSKAFFHPEDLEKLAYPKRDVLQKSEDHPWKWLADRYGWENVALEQDGSFTLPENEANPNEPLNEKTQDWKLEDFGLRIPSTPEENQKHDQKILFDKSPIDF